VDDIVVMELDGRWVVTREGIIFARRSTARGAVKVAIRSAAETAQSGEHVRVLMDDECGPRRVIWESRPMGATEVRTRSAPFPV
jgi:hypothetical protein